MGSGFRTFTAGEVLTASNVQNYLMDQSVMVFASSSARASAIGTANFEEGMVTYLTDVDQVQAYNGSSWAQVGQTPGLVLLNTTSFSAVSSVSLAANSFSTTYDRYLIKLLYKVNSTAGSLRLKFRSAGSDISTSYYYSGNYTRSSNTSGVTYGSNDAAYYSTNSDSKADAAPNMLEIELLNPLSTERKHIFTRVSHWTSGDVQESSNVNGFCSSASTADSFTMYITGVGTITGSYQLYGFNK